MRLVLALDVRRDRRFLGGTKNQSASRLFDTLVGSRVGNKIVDMRALRSCRGGGANN